MNPQLASRHVSASQMETFAGCPRKWAYSRVRPRVTNLVAEFGKRVHKILDKWMKNGTPPDGGTKEGRCALAMLHLIPPPDTAGKSMEHQFNCLFFGIAHKGAIDLVWGFSSSSVVIEDHKTKGSKRQIMTSNELLKNIQRIVYAYWAVAMLGVSEVVSKWNFVDRGGKWAESVAVCEQRKDIEERFHDLYQRTSLLIYQAQGAPPEMLPRNTEECFRYGARYPCPYANECLGGQDLLSYASAILQSHEEKKLK